MLHTSPRRKERRVDHQQQAGQQQQPGGLWAAGIFFVALVFLLIVLSGYVQEWEWTGFPNRTLWDWLELLIIPVVIAGGGLWFNQQQERQREDVRRQQERGLEIENQRAQDEALQTYLDQIGQLLLDRERPLRQSEEGDEVRTLARTLTVLSTLESDLRKRSVVEFLYEADLIN
jgi:hypothetical protein